MASNHATNKKEQVNTYPKARTKRHKHAHTHTRRHLALLSTAPSATLNSRISTTSAPGTVLAFKVTYTSYPANPANGDATLTSHGPASKNGRPPLVALETVGGTTRSVKSYDIVDSWFEMETTMGYCPARSIVPSTVSAPMR